MGVHRSTDQRQRTSRWFRRARLATGLTLLVASAIGIGYPLFWNHRSQVGSAKLIRQQIARINSTKTSPSSSTGTSGTCSPQLGPGLLIIPNIGLEAPVQQGLSNSVLDVAVGHDPTTGWPGPSSTGLFAAHDVSFFSQINLLKSGDIVDYVVPCGTLKFAVTGSQVTHPGASIQMPASGGIVLDTCWPPNALFYTPDRYIVTAKYLGSTPSTGQATKAPATVTIPTYSLKIPPALASQGITLATNSQIMGTMSYSPTTSSSYKQSPATLTFAGDGLNLWFGLLHSLAQSRSDWISQIAPGVNLPPGLLGASLHSTTPLEINEQVDGTTPKGLTMQTTLNGHIPITVNIKVNGSTMAISSIQTS